jgi:hypothetical protein
MLPAMLDDATAKQHNVIIRPHGPGVTFLRRARGRPARSGCAAGRTRRARWPRVAGVLDRVPLALERDTRLGPQRVH